MVKYDKEKPVMTLLIELKKELRKTEQARKECETKIATLKQKETRIRQLAAEFSGSSPVTSASLVRRPMPEEHRRKISEALKRRHAQNKT
jgi:N-methylhydantoinase B/oxoprolinase/acetone carboxylase alpha subunit